MNRDLVPETWSPEEALTVAAFLEHLLQEIHDLYGLRLERARARHQWLAGEDCSARELRGKLPF